MEQFIGILNYCGPQGEKGEGIPAGGVTGQVLVKHSGDDYDTEWTTPAGALVSSVNGKTGAVVLDHEDVGALSDETFIPSKTSDITNDSGYITNDVEDLENYYLKTETYTQTEIDDAIDDAKEEVEAEIPSVINNVTSTLVDDALSANMGKQLQDQISNLKNIGRFLAIWDCTTGLPTSEPITGTPYMYNTGDYYRVGAIASEGGTNYKPYGDSYTGAASTTVATESGLNIGAVYYYDGNLWRLQASGGGGTVQDVQVAGTSVLGSGIANIPLATSNNNGAMSSVDKNKLDGIEDGADVNVLEGVQINGTDLTISNKKVNIPNASVSESGVIKTGSSFNTNVLSSGYMQAVTNTYEQYQSKGNDAFVGKGTLENVLDNESVRFDKATSLTDAQKTQGRANIGAFGAEPYVEGGTYVEGMFYYVPEE